MPFLRSLPSADPTSRREFLQASAASLALLGAAACGVAGTGESATGDGDSSAPTPAPETGLPPAREIAALTPAHFQQAEGQVFRVQRDGQDAQLTLTQVSETRVLTHPQAGRFENFSVFLESRGSAPRLEQDLWTLSHPAVGTHALLMVPVGLAQPAKPHRYQVVFNLSRPA